MLRVFATHTPQAMHRKLHRSWGVPCILATTAAIAAAQSQPDNFVSFDDEQNIVAINHGQSFRKASRGHCSEALGTVDQQTMVCLVSNTASNASQPQAEIYYVDKPTIILNPGGPIFDLRYLDDDRQIVISSHPRANLTRDALYETATGNLIDKIDEPADISTLPQWAKSPAQLAHEAVPMSPALTEERNAWISKVMSQIQSIHPGMRRRDLDVLFKTEGGLSSPQQRAYVFIECPWIKIDVRFHPATNGKKMTEESPDDVIESVSKPYLEGSIMD